MVLNRNAALAEFTLLLQLWVVNWIIRKGTACSVSVSQGGALSIHQHFHYGARKPYLNQKY